MPRLTCHRWLIAGTQLRFGPVAERYTISPVPLAEG